MSPVSRARLFKTDKTEKSQSASTGCAGSGPDDPAMPWADDDEVVCLQQYGEYRDSLRKKKRCRPRAAFISHKREGWECEGRPHGRPESPLREEIQKDIDAGRLHAENNGRVEPRYTRSAPVRRCGRNRRGFGERLLVLGVLGVLLARI